MVHLIAKGRNAATGQGGRALWERTERTTAALQPLAIRRVFPAGCVLHWRAPFTLMRLYSCDTTLASLLNRSLRLSCSRYASRCAFEISIHTYCMIVHPFPASCASHASLDAHVSIQDVGKGGGDPTSKRSLMTQPATVRPPPPPGVTKGARGVGLSQNPQPHSKQRSPHMASDRLRLLRKFMSIKKLFVLFQISTVTK